MNKSILISGIALVFVFGTLTFVSCGGGEEKSNTEVNQEVFEGDDGDQLAEASVYQCSMLCEGDKTYDVAGSCPKCGMDLKEISGDEGSDHDHDGDQDDHEHED
jgi:ssDNA-binding Zn-finger/Zn-ribbon topoisomerase 1